MRIVVYSFVFMQIVVIVVRGVHMHSKLRKPIPSPDPEYLQIFALPVGQGDCTIIQCPGSGDIIIFDCGSSGGNYGNRFRHEDVKKFLGDSIDKVKFTIITSHGDRDHVDYLTKISWKTKNVIGVILGGELSDYSSYHNWVQEWESMGKLFDVNKGEPCIATVSTKCAITSFKSNEKIETLNFCGNDNIDFKILAANVGKSKNEKSIVLKIIQGGWSMLLSGDMEGTASKQIANVLGSALQSVVYKMSHHGASSKANLDEWLEPIRPKYAFASSAHQFGMCRHPRCVAIIRLLSYGTITNGEEHRFYCSDAKGYGAIIDPISRNILQTTVNPDTICILGYSSSPYFSPTAHCGAIGVDEPEPDDDCASSNPFNFVYTPGDATLTSTVNDCGDNIPS